MPSTTTTARGAVAFARHTLSGLQMLIAFTVVLGLLYPVAVTAVGQLAMPWQANGSLVRADGSRAEGREDGEVVGSLLMAQGFEGPEWFHPRPSAADYDTLASGGSNLGPESPELVAAIEERRASVAADNGVPVSAVPADAVTASSSGLDPHISPAYARLQVERVASARGLPVEQVEALVREHSAARALGVLGDPRVHVLSLNLELDALG
ncbi:potassium-transporting ATPase subunit KdpC [Serinicoccus sediminis]|uniref:potassium-transporting ATPase subunit KdpC n=1 Tax=Serinicoccus sediminis TaxID=2306021 RepID=UPI0010226290